MLSQQIQYKIVVKKKKASKTQENYTDVHFDRQDQISTASNGQRQLEAQSAVGTGS